MPTDEVGVFYANQPSQADPSYSISRADARALKASGQGFFINHGKDIRLLAPMEIDQEQLLEGLKARDTSAQMPPKITLDYVMGKARAIAIVEAWA